MQSSMRSNFYAAFSASLLLFLASPAAASLPSFFDVFTDMSYSTDTIVQRQDYGFYWLLHN